MRGRQDWDQYRKAIIRETEVFIEWGLLHPEDVDWIPSKPVNNGGFPRAVADWFYGSVFLGVGEKAGFWRRKIRSGAALLRRAASRRGSNR